MAEIECVNQVDDLIKIRNVIVSCTNKEGLISNKGNDGSIIEDLHSNGILGFIAKKNPDVLFISTGGTYQFIKSAGLNVLEVSEYTGYPEMKTGLVKSLHPKIHAGILAHKYTESDAEYLGTHNISYIDAVIVNFYALEEIMNNHEATFEMVRQAIDIGGPTMSHNARKAFISTTLITSPKEYPLLMNELKDYNGAVSLKMRLILAKKASKWMTEYLVAVDKAIQSVTYEELETTYQILN